MKTLILIFVLLATTCLYSTIINVPGDLPTIQAGIEAAADTDTVLVAEGTYYENIDFIGKAITVASNFIIDGEEAHIENTIINGSQPTNPDFGSCVSFTSGEGNESVIKGFTVTAGTGTYIEDYDLVGGGIFCTNSSPKIISNIITYNTANWSGGISTEESSPIIMNNVISYNTATTDNCGGLECYSNSNAYVEGNIITYNTAQESAGGVVIQDCSPTLINNIITNNSADFGGGILFYNSVASITNCLISGNNADLRGGGLYFNNSDASIITNCTISENSATGNGGGVYCNMTSYPVLINAIMWNDLPQEIYVVSGGVTATYSDIEGGWTGTGNIDEDPLFVGTGDHPFMLQDLSPCVNAGTTDTTSLNLPEFDLAGNSRVFGGRVDMGAYEFGPSGVNQNLIPVADLGLYNYPNPFNPSTTIEFDVVQTSSFVTVEIFNLKGQKVKQLISDQFSAGKHSALWDGKDDNNKHVSSGIYFYKMKTGNFEKTRKMILMK